jgi:hypothetical protein
MLRPKELPRKEEKRDREKPRGGWGAQELRGEATVVVVVVVTIVELIMKIKMMITRDEQKKKVPLLFYLLSCN